MATKILMTAIGQQLIADVKQVENKETKEVIGYWLSNARIVGYTQGDDDQVSVNFGAYCLVSSDTEFSVRADHIVSILEPRSEVLERYEGLIPPTTTEEVEETTEETDAAEPDTTEEG